MLSSKALRLIGLCIFTALFLYNLQAAPICDWTTGCLTDYWAGFWFMTYENGYIRRALVGSIFAAIQPQTALALNIAAISVLVVICILTLRLMLFVALSDRLFVRATFLIGPTTMVFVETLGDPMHVALLLFLAICTLPEYLRRAGLVVILPILAAIHEASIFLIWPAGVALLLKDFEGRAYIALTAVLILVGLVSLHLLGQPNILEQAAQLVAFDGTQVSINPRYPPPLSVTIRNEIQYHFGDTVSTLKMIYALGGFVLWPVSFLLVLGHVRGNATALLNFIVLLGFALPLFILAHDWARFAVFLLFATLVLEANSVDLLRTASGILGTLRTLAMRACSRVPPAMVFVFPALFVAHDNYRTWGLLPLNLLVLLLVWGLLLAYKRTPHA